MPQILGVAPTRRVQPVLDGEQGGRDGGGRGQGGGRKGGAFAFRP